MSGRIAKNFVLFKAVLGQNRAKACWFRVEIGSDKTCSCDLLRERPFLSSLTHFCGISSVIIHESWPQCLSVPGGTCMPKTLTNSGTCQSVLCIHITTLT